MSRCKVLSGELRINISRRFNLPESPRWLLARGRIDALGQLIQRIARRNNITLADNFQDQLQAPENANENVSILTLFNSTYRNRTLTMAIIWFSLILLYFGITLHMNALGGNIFTNTVSVSYTISLRYSSNVILVVLSSPCS